MKREAHPDVAFVGRSGKRAAVRRVAVVVLEGAEVSELRTSLAWARRFRARPVLVAVDGGLSTCRAARRRPDLFVGDLDSSSAAPAGIPSRIYPAAKDFSDFAGALSEARALRADLVVVAGLLGGRLDHEWANLLAAAAAVADFAGIVAPAARGLVVVTAGGVRARVPRPRLVSVFALGGIARVSLRGAKWALSRRRLPPGSLGLSNLTEGELALDVHAGAAALVFPA